MAKMNYEKATYELVRALPARFQEILSSRFGLGGKDPLTLEAIGTSHSITRERVRQIVEEGLQLLREDLKTSKKTHTEGIFEHFKKALESVGSIKREDLLLDMLEVRNTANEAIFLLTVGENFYNQRETRDFFPFWSLDETKVENALMMYKDLVGFFEEKGQAMGEEHIAGKYGKGALSYLEVSKSLMRGHDGRWGLSHWPEVNPRGMRDKAYLALKELGKPLHFTEVAKAITHLQDRLSGRKKKNVLPQTVHNELIKDGRFVLVGRGTYGLKDWGLEQGTIKDIMVRILKGSLKPLSREEIIQKTLEKRKAKESTIQLNLQDRSRFLRHENGTYSLVN